MKYFEVAWTIKWIECGSYENLLWLAFPHSLMQFYEADTSEFIIINF